MERRWLAQTVIGLALLPLSLVPLWMYTTRTDSGYLMFLKARYSLFAPRTAAMDAATARAAAIDRAVPYKGVPVLVYHGIGRIPADAADRRFVVSRPHFAEQMRALQAAGYTAITTRRLAAYLRGGRVLPKRPILITFDDGRFDAMLQGDPVLRDTGMRATMFVIGHASESSSPYYVQWGKLGDYARSGRWELASHTFDLHHRVPAGRHDGSALAEPNPGESIRRYAERVSADLAKEADKLRGGGAHGVVAFAYPYGDWGERRPAVAAALRRVLRRRFQVAFDQDYQPVWRPTTPGGEPLRIHRLSVENWSGGDFLRRLERGYRIQRQRSLDDRST
jgi:peptidoglycan/xylan/chitin deacetylase (PgdA/CDA1 family)